jgi:hypothetical protein
MTQTAKSQTGDRSPPSPENLPPDPDPPLKLPIGRDLEPWEYLLDPDTEMDLELLTRYPPPE